MPSMAAFSNARPRFIREHLPGIVSGQKPI
jgi:hypothetical protein